MKRRNGARDGDYSEEGLELLGCVSLSDPVRPEAKLAVQECLRAGIRPVLVTGDHLRTAESVARQTGILGSEGESVLSGQDLRWRP